MRHSGCVLAITILLGAAHLASADGAPDPLFRAAETIPVTITGPITELIRKRPVEDELDATFRFTDAGRPVEASVKLRARGNYRRQRATCPFPPVRINFKKGDVKDTVFHQQDKVKLVTHCRDGGGSYFAATHRELLAYQVFNLLTDRSFRVRLLEITWIDTDKKNRDDTHYGFIIEHKDRLGKRLDRVPLEIERTTVAELDPAYTNLVSLFQLFIANTDFSPIAGPPDDACCHNAVLMGRADEPILPVPYDFDMSGFVNAPYASPNPRFKLRSVKERKYRGRCANNRWVNENVALFNEHRDAIEALIADNAYLDERDISETLKFTGAFYEIINDPRKLKQRVTDDCI